MGKEVVWSPKAINEFDKIIKYLGKEWSNKEVKKFILRTNKIVDQISSGTIKFRTSGKKSIHEVLITKHNLLIYKIKSEQILLMTFYDTRQHPKKKRV
jgi:hypothetical protein